MIDDLVNQKPRAGQVRGAPVDSIRDVKSDVDQARRLVIRTTTEDFDGQEEAGLPDVFPCR